METFPRFWPFGRGNLRWPVNSPHKGRWRGALMFSLICAWINGWVNNYDAIVMLPKVISHCRVTKCENIKVKPLDLPIRMHSCLLLWCSEYPWSQKACKSMALIGPHPSCFITTSHPDQNKISTICTPYSKHIFLKGNMCCFIQM